jgi:Sulfotransferase family
VRAPFRRQQPEQKPKRFPAPFIVGVSRSGTTLLRLMLDAHPELTIPPETHFFSDVARACRAGATAEELIALLTSQRRWGDFQLDADELLGRLRAKEEPGPRFVLRSFYELYAERQGKPRWGDKTPGYAERIKRINQVLPESRFVHLIRDGRDAALSRARRAHKAEPIEVAASRWKRRILKAREQGAQVEHYLELRYEDLVAEPEAEVRRVCELIELDFDPVMLRYHEHASERMSELDRDLEAESGKRARPAEARRRSHELAVKPPTTEGIGRWRAEMSDQDKARFEAEAGDLLAELGYEPAGTPSAARS